MLLCRQGANLGFSFVQLLTSKRNLRYQFLLAIAKNNPKKQDQQIKSTATTLKKSLAVLRKQSAVDPKLKDVEVLGENVLECLASCQKLRNLLNEPKKT